MAFYRKQTMARTTNPWEETNRGLEENKCHHVINNEQGLSIFQTDKRAVSKSLCSKDAVGSHNAKLISSPAISQMIDENISGGTGLALPLQSVISPPNACTIKQFRANRSAVNINGAIRCLPSRLGTEASSGENVSGANLSRGETKQGQKQKKGFSSITVTSRRIDVNCHHTERAATRDQVLLKCPGNYMAKNATTAFNNGESSVQRSLKQIQSRKLMILGIGPLINASHTKLKVRHANEEAKQSSTRGHCQSKEQHLFTSCVYIRVSQQCSNTIYYLDKSLSLPRYHHPETKGQAIQRSEFSFKIRGKSIPPSVDGLDGPSCTPRHCLLHLQQESPKQLFQADNSKAGVIKVTAVQIPPSPRGNMAAEYQHGYTAKTSNESGLLVDLPNGKLSLLVQEGTKLDTYNVHISGKTRLKFFDRLDEKGSWTLFGSPKKEHPDSCPPLSASEASVEEDSPYCKILLPGLHPPLESSLYQPERGSCTCTAMNEHGMQRGKDISSGDCDGCLSNGGITERVEKNRNDEDCLVTTKHQSTITRGLCEPSTLFLGPVVLTLREALELHRPGFISHSRQRIQKLEHMAQLRKAQSSENLAPEKKQLHSSVSSYSRRKLYTVPHPLSDNLFKPKERAISEKEMQLRSKRIYNSLPEVKKKQEDQQKKVVLQSNRQRAELFKKKLLNRVLHRNMD
ncbi:(E2-independent) E3 ubiquitin-conjugating enzyme FATS isoform X2 [Ambystoma mexicanum]|uniref:(E2-independent) E3 ubiquitin-conjugating enzyme FATS isoform X2 n=1 Tax=Ambystoma mexicanum TaxID=8296 RepID=UPI0037E8F47E